MEDSANYIVNLDSIDLNLISTWKLKTQINTGTNVMPLWSVQGRDDNYYEFEIHGNTRSDFKESGDCEENNSCYTCELCAIAVPIAFRTRHERSRLHRACAAIARTALQRAAKLAVACSSGSAGSTGDSKYCSACARALPRAMRRQHEQTNSHCIAAEKLARLRQLRREYTGSESNSDSESSGVEEGVEVEGEGKSAGVSPEGLKTYVTAIQAIGVDVSDVKGGVLVNTVSGRALQLDLFQFLGYRSNGATLQCLLCRIVIQDAEEHMWTEMHINLVAAPIQNKHCIRKLDDTWSHCMLCNEIIGDVQIHTKYNTDHKNHLKTVIVSSTNTRPVSDDVDSDPNMHTNEVAQNSRTTKSIQGKMLTDPIHYHLKQKKSGNIKCLICKIGVSAKEQHVESQEHIDKYNNLLNINRIRKYNDKFYCDACKVTVSKDCEIRHIKKKHTKKLLALMSAEFNIPPQNDVDIFLPTKSDKYYCKFCKVLVSQSVTKKKKHTKQQNHIHKMLLYYNKIVTTVKGKLFCGFCGTTMPNGTELYHINSLEHKNKRSTDTISAINEETHDDIYTSDYDLYVSDDEEYYRYEDYYSYEGGYSDSENEYEGQDYIKNLEFLSTNGNLIDFQQDYKKSLEIASANENLINLDQVDQKSLELASINESLIDTDQDSEKYAELADRNDNIIGSDLENKRSKELASTNENLNDSERDNNKYFELADANEKLIDSDQEDQKSLELGDANKNLTDLDEDDDKNLKRADRNENLIDSDQDGKTSLGFASANEMLIDSDQDNEKSFELAHTNESSIDSDRDDDKSLELVSINANLNDQDNKKSLKLSLKTTDTERDTYYYYQVNETDVNYHLETFDEIVTGSDSNIVDRRLLYANKLILRENGFYYCGYCLTHVWKDEVLGHIDRESHKTNSKYSVIKSSMDINDTGEDTFFCTLCKSHVFNVQNCIRSHALGPKHIKNLKKHLNKSSTTDILDSNIKEMPNETVLSCEVQEIDTGLYFCKFCDVFVVAQVLSTHLDGYDHKNNLQNKLKTSENILDAHSSEDDKNISVLSSFEINLDFEENFIEYLEHAFVENSVENITLLKEVPTASEIQPIISVVESKPKLNLTTPVLEDDVIEAKSLSPIDKEKSKVTENKHQNKFTISYGDDKVFEAKPAYLSDKDKSKDCTLNIISSSKELEFKLESNIDREQSTNSCNQESTNKCFERKKPLADMTNTNTEVSKWEYLMELTDNKLICQICVECVPNAANSIDTHVQGSRHTELYKLKINENQINLVGNAYYCKICSVFICSKNEMNHIGSDEHKEKLSLYLDPSNVNGIVKGKRQRIRKRRTKDSMVNIDNADEKSRSASGDRSNILVTPQPTDITKQAYQTYQLYPQIEVNNISNIATIFHGVVNSNATKDCGNSQNDKNTQLSTKNAVVNTDTTENYSYLMAINSRNAIEMTCKICGVIITNNRENIKGHVQGVKHKTKYEEYLDENYIKKAGYNLNCTKCDIVFLSNKLFYHISSKKHRAIVNDASTVHTKSNEHKNIHTSVTNSKLNVRNATIGKNTTEENYDYLISSTNQNKITCRVCDVIVPDHFENIKGHVHGMKHKTRYREILRENELQNVGDKLYCEKCDVLINENNIFNHIASNTHKGIVHKVVSTVNGYHIEINENSTMCKACKVKVPNTVTNIEEHVKGTRHLTAYDSVLDANGIKKVNNQLYCNNCKTYINISNEYNHIERATHKEIISLNNSRRIASDVANHMGNKSDIKSKNQIHIQANATTENEIVISTPTTGHYLMEQSKNPKELVCKVCKVVVPNKADSIKTHVNGLRHKTTYKSLLMSSGVKIDNNIIYCEPCNCHIVKPNEFQHIDNDMHKKKFKAWSKNQTVKNETKSENENNETANDSSYYLMLKNINEKEVFCSICNANVPNILDLVKQHVNGVKHRNLYADVLNSNKLNQINGDIYCEICKIYMNKGEEMEHMLDNTHKDKLHSKPTTSRIDSRSIKTNTKNEVLNAKPKNKIHYLMQETNTETLICKLCNIIVNTDVKEHIETITHKCNYDSVLNANNLCRRGNELFCDSCEKTIELTTELEHIKDENHKRKMANHLKTSIKEETEYCNVCNVHIASRTVHEKGLLHIASMQKKNDSFCQICNLGIFEDFDDHCKSTSHNSKLESIILLNNIKVNKEICYCPSCDLHFTKLSLMKHVQRREHLLKNI